MEIDEPQPQQQQRRRIVPWVEKYRPEAVDDIAHQEEVVKTLKSSIESGSLPHLLFHGPPGTGKTTTILAVARALYGPELFRARILELNASDERGIAVIREKVKTFAQGAVGGQKTPGYPCPRFKLIILDEADTMTSDAQSALRRVMETYSKVTRFCLICNYVTRIIEPLASRCAKFRFKPLPVDSMVARLRHIAQSENVDLSKESLDTIMEISQGDMRKAVTFIQSSHQLSAGSVITPDLIYEISGQVPPNVMQKLWASICNGSIDRMLTEVSDIIAEGYPVAAILAKLQSMTLEGATSEGMNPVSNINKALICEKIAQVEKCLLNGSSEALQLRDLGAFVMRRLNGGSTQSEATLVA